MVTVGDILHRGDFIERPKAPLLEEQLQAALVNARHLSADNSPDSAAAWEGINLSRDGLTVPGVELL